MAASFLGSRLIQEGGMSANNSDDFGKHSETLTRREALKIGAGAVAGLAAAPRAFASLRPSDPPKPNFVFFIQEGVRADEYSCFKIDGWDGNNLSAMGNRIISTPHLDRIVNEGISFPNAFVTNALCLPSRASILTGLYGHETGCIDNRNRSIPNDVPTIADILRDAGYEVAFFGKIHVNRQAQRNWDYFFGFEAAGANYYHPSIVESVHGNAKPPRTYQGYVDDIVTARALEWLKQKREKPFCLIFGFTAPHAPFYRARRHLDLYDGAMIPKPVTFDDDLKGYPGKPLAFKIADNKIGTTILGNDDPRSLEEMVKDHMAGVVSNDDNAASIMAYLEQAGILDDTALVITSDHGFFLGEWRFYDKRFMHEPSIRVPMAFRYPRMIKSGLAPTQMALNLDIPPTILELAGVQIPDWMQGQSLVPFMQGTAPATWRTDWLYEYYEYPGIENVMPHRGVRTERYKLIHYFLAPEEFELYDLQEDPGELHNLAYDPAHAKLRQQLIDRVAELRRLTGDEYHYQEPNDFEFQRERQDLPSPGRGPGR
jgi:arylsulfatase A-like enzyme